MGQGHMPLPLDRELKICCLPRVPVKRGVSVQPSIEEVYNLELLIERVEIEQY